VRVRHLWDPVRIGALELRNRIVMPGMGTFLGDPDRPGVLSAEQLAHYEAAAAGGAGLVLVEVTPVRFPAGAATLRQPGLATDEQEAAFAELARRVHAHGAALGVQLVHHGKVALADAARGEPVLVPSAGAGPRLAGDLVAGLSPDELARLAAVTGGRFPEPREATDEDLAEVVRAFAEAAQRARRAGLDCVEVHAAHGYLLSSFCSPAWNRRRDRWGGSPEARSRLAVETVRAVKEAAGADFPVLVRIDAAEHGVPGGITCRDAVGTARRLVAAGADAIDVSASGDPTSAVAFTEGPLPWRAGQYLADARTVRRALGGAVPVVAVGRLDPRLADAAVAAGAADLVALGRALLADPDLPRRLAPSGAAASARRGGPGPRPCVACFVCVAGAFFDEPVRCAVNPRLGRRVRTAGWDRPAPRSRRVVVVGGGPAGLECARVAAARGHSVVVLEREAVAGGALVVAGLAHPPMGDLARWLAEAALDAGAELRTATVATPEVVAGLDPDDIVIATGARYALPALPGLGTGHPRACTLADLARRGLPAGPRVAVVGDGGPALVLAVALSRRARVALACTAGSPGLGVAHPRRARLVFEGRRRGLVIHTGVRAEALGPQGLLVRDPHDRERVVEADDVVFADPLPAADGPHPGAPWTGALVPAAGRRPPRAGGARVHCIGDVAGPGGLEAAIRGGFDLGAAI
jgi:2,4-dienoyl-CoA reductase (NADPH2)